MFRTVTVAMLSLSLSGLPAYAADREGENRPTPLTLAVETPSAPAIARDGDWSLPAPRIGSPARRPAGMPALYVSLAALQAFDGYSTLGAVARGAREANPLMQGIAGNSAAMWGVKTAATLGPILLAERMWRANNRKGAVIVMLLANGIALAVAANNARVLQQQR